MVKLIELTKVCSKCGLRKEWVEYTKSKDCKFGVCAFCKGCGLARKRDHYKKNKDAILEQNRRYYGQNKTKVLESQKKYRINNKDKTLKRNKLYCNQNREKVSSYIKKYNSRSYVRDNRNRCRNKKRKTDPKINLNCRMSGAIRKTLKEGKGGKTWLSLIDYTIDDLIERLKKTMPKGYTWQDFLKKNVLHIDHVTPVKVFNYTNPEHQDFKRCWALENLQLLPAKENLSKGAKLDKPFQPSLLM